MKLHTILLALCLTSCVAVSPAVAQSHDAPLPAVVRDVSSTLTPVVVNAIESVASALPSAAEPDAPLVHPDAVALIIRWEIGSASLYRQRYRGVVWPGASSGPTWGIGYDGGHATRRTIAADWALHDDVDRLVGTSGVTGLRAKAELWRWKGVLTDYDYAVLVFATRSLIEYERQTRRAFRDGYDALPSRARGALVSLVYNRGASMTGDSRREMRALRDDCVPDGNVACMAREIRAMKRLWPSLKGLRDRRDDEARLAAIGGA